MVGLVVLAVALALCAVLLFVSPPAAEALVRLLPPALQGSDAAVETVFALTFFGGLAACAMIGAGLSGFNGARLGPRPGRNAALGAMLGGAGVAAATVYAWLAGAIHPATTSAAAPMLAWGTAVVLLQTSAEEIYFRGWLQRVLAERWGSRAGILVAAIAFAALHVLGGARSPVSVANLFLGGLLFGMLAAQGGGLAAAVAAHFSWNWLEEIGFGLSPNPGLGGFGALINLDLAGPALWGGSEEGLNASLAMTLTLLALLVPLVLLSRRGRASARPPAPDRPSPAGP